MDNIDKARVITKPYNIVKDDPTSKDNPENLLFDNLKEGEEPQVPINHPIQGDSQPVAIVPPAQPVNIANGAKRTRDGNENPEDFINGFLQTLIQMYKEGKHYPMAFGGLMFELSKATGVKDTEGKATALINFFDKLATSVKSGENYNVTLDQNGDGVLNAKDLEKIFKDA